MPTSDDPTASERKKDHIDLAFKSQILAERLDLRFYYEPLFAGHPNPDRAYGRVPFAGKVLNAPVWVSSMTGGTQMARTINHHLARACNEFRMGMGLGSCRGLLFSDDTLSDFDVRGLIGDDLPLFANLGIAQLEELIRRNELYRVNHLLDKLRADGLIIHVNPMQEWMQPEGDVFEFPPLQTIERVLESGDIPVIVKEVGQGMGYESLKTLLQMPLVAIDFGASGGTNFSMLELLRSNQEQQDAYGPLTLIGHSALEMTQMCNQLVADLGAAVRCQQLIISGGVRGFLDGYYLTEISKLPAVYGQASGFLKYAQKDYETLRQHIQRQMEGLKLAKAYLRVR